MDGRRLLVAEVDGMPVGYTVLSPVPARAGWLVEQIVRCDGAPNGTAESLVAAAARRAADTGGRFITLGTSPLSRRGRRLSRRHPLWLRAGMAWMRAHGSRFYNFRGLEHFKAKFRPQAWEPVYAVVADPRLRPTALYAVMGAFTGRSPLWRVSRRSGRARRWKCSGWPGVWAGRAEAMLLENTAAYLSSYCWLMKTAPDEYAAVILRILT